MDKKDLGESNELSTRETLKFLRLRALEQAVIAYLGQEALKKKKLERVLDLALKAIKQTLKVPIGAIFELMPDGSRLILKYGYGWKKGIVGKPTGYVLNTRRSVIIKDLNAEKRFGSFKLLKKHKVKSGINVLIEGVPHPYGVLGVYSTRERKFTDDEVNFLQSVANILASAIKRDVDEERMKLWNENLEQEKIKDEVILSNIGDGLIVTDKDAKIVLVNNALESMLGWERGEATGRRFSEICKIYDRNKKEVPLNKSPIFLAGKGVKIFTKEIFYQRKDGALFPVAITTTPYKIGKDIKGSITLVRDITQERLIDRAKTEFISLASHQLRTPLSAINWLSEMLLESLVNQAKEFPKTYVKEIYESSQRMVTLINALLNVSRVESGSIFVEPKELKLVPFIQSILDELGMLAKAKSLDVSVHCQPQSLKVKADLDIMRIVLHNLISNAIKYTNKGGNIKIDIYKKNKEILIGIKDTGIGIPESAQKRIFEKFFRADNAHTVSSDGTGLGLYIVKSIIDQVGGRIWFESREGAGTSFYIALPKNGMAPQPGYKGLIA